MKKLLIIVVFAISGILFSALGVSAQSDSVIPEWIKNNAGWWSDGTIDDDSFLNGIKYLIENNIITIDSTESFVDQGDFILVQSPSNSNIINKEIFVDNSNYFETQVGFLNEVFILPVDVQLTVKHCGEPDYWYDSDQREMIYCYEMIEIFYEVNLDLEEGDETMIDGYVMDAVDFTFYSMIGSTLDWEYALPTTGSEGDIYDQFASYMILEFTDDVDLATNTLFNYAYVLHSIDNTELIKNIDYFANPPSSEQRAYNIFCYVYGKDSGNWQFLIENEWLPKDRASYCEIEYSNIVYAWDILLENYFKK
jgi:hypothetical protein